MASLAPFERSSVSLSCILNHYKMMFCGKGVYIAHRCNLPVEMHGHNSHRMLCNQLRGSLHIDEIIVKRRLAEYRLQTSFLYGQYAGDEGVSRNNHFCLVAPSFQDFVCSENQRESL